mmetsp:Transcript_53885/g.148577  ORF Transcript_53885/g.148577 Transcript_53885/m.148577 type:complete len:243 (+) Transcript_53885:273-1001(+)
MQAVVTGSILHARPPHPNWRNQLRIGERSTAATPTAHRLAAEILLGAPSARLPAQLHRLLVRTEEDETSDRDPSDARADARHERGGALLLEDGDERVDRANVEFARLGLVAEHHASFDDVERRRHCRGDAARERAARGALDSARVLSLRLAPRGLEALVHRELYEGEGDLTRDGGPIAHEEARDAVLRQDALDRLRVRRVRAHLHVLRHDRRRHPHEARGHLAKARGQGVVDRMLLSAVERL